MCLACHNFSLSEVQQVMAGFSPQHLSRFNQGFIWLCPFQALGRLSFQASSYYWPNPVACLCSPVIPISLLIIRTLRGLQHFLLFYPFSKPAMETLFPIKSFSHFEFLLPGRAQSPWGLTLSVTPRIICPNLSAALGPEL